MTPYNNLKDVPHWKCPNCNGLNSEPREKCLECDLPKPEKPQYRHKFHKPKGRFQES